MFQIERWCIFRKRFIPRCIRRLATIGTLLIALIIAIPLILASFPTLRRSLLGHRFDGRLHLRLFGFDRLVNPINGDYFSFDVVCNSLGNTAEAVYGSYVGVASEAEVKPNTFLAGAMDGSQFMNSWYKLVEDDYIVQASGGPMMSGNISVDSKK